ncbi:hypothetical protein BO94DRAFT_581167 [Aspergillus sclerotioniger CBS 115572]|uniref:Uncharacterized protein n=1 Tax=Aspergillus sclerotioniger CBS 115572 TaxID=1450535 RepID=A0A317XBL3_9EURO|nr:hypothetical protein BO94DRAFT_581167 [Aspergillus sclerotioniger CBS 115572]PWY96024.1 hypothetical protein BO94DRAFT_581167 [Aspergillus sclerotioniger CBS 115572]
MKDRASVVHKFILLRNGIKQQLNIEIKRVHGDSASEHAALVKYCLDQGINCHTIEPTIAVMTDNQLPGFLWDRIVVAVTYIYNRLSHDSIGKTPHETLPSNLTPVTLQTEGYRVIPILLGYHNDAVACVEVARSGRLGRKVYAPTERAMNLQHDASVLLGHLEANKGIKIPKSVIDHIRTVQDFLVDL